MIPDLFPFGGTAYYQIDYQMGTPSLLVVGVFFIGNDLECGMKKPNIIINELDAERLDILLEQPTYADSPVAEALNEELDRAEILPPAKMPTTVVTMNSRIRFEDLSGRKRYPPLVYWHR